MKFIPKCFLENYTFLEKEAFNFFPKNPSLIFSAVGNDQSELFSIWVSKNIEKGVPFINYQHGGNYGCAKVQTYEFLEVDNSNYFIKVYVMYTTLPATQIFLIF